MPPAPAMALSAYAPGELAKLTPEQRGRALKRSKRPKLDPALMSHLLTR
jgi:hypothetical protein